MSEPATSIPDKTLAESGFYWRETGSVRVLVCRPLEEAGFANGFSTRLGGVSQMSSETPTDLNLAGYDEDASENIEENRRRFLAAFDDGYKLSSVWQVHGDGVKLVRDMDDAARTEEKYDALASDLAGLLVGVKTADCVPVLIGDPKTGGYAAVHAGWRGTVQSIAVKAIDLMKKEFGSDPANLVAAIGPAACGRNYEIGQDVIDAFGENFSASDSYFSPTREGHALVDLHLANRDQIIGAGIKPENIYTAPFCTMENTGLFFSYRVEKRKYGKTGRLMSVIGRKR
ncbi:MAG: peptidoglycan editing factor PgeF [Pyrinomonadaceae bacterium]|nr:peptidoglycan editing factor PgeF [Pyrinomonadaceae bacterium]